MRSIAKDVIFNTVSRVFNYVNYSIDLETESFTLWNEDLMAIKLVLA